MNSLKTKIAELERVLKHKESTAQHHWAKWRVLREEMEEYYRDDHV